MSEQRQRDRCRFNDHIGCACPDPDEHCLWHSMNDVDNAIAGLNTTLGHIRRQLGIDTRGPGQWENLARDAHRIIEAAKSAQEQQPDGQRD